MNYAIVYTADAARDLEDIYDYVAGRDGLTRASDLLEKLIDLLYDRIQPYRDRIDSSAAPEAVLAGVAFSAPES